MVSDSAQFSALAAQACPQRYVGTALTLMNSIGFAITVVSIEWVIRLYDLLGAYVAWILAPGPLLGLLLLNLAPGPERAEALDDEEPTPVTAKDQLEGLLAYPYHQFTAPERSGGPSLF